MAQTVLITLTVAGANTGPFNLYSNVDGYVSAFEIAVSKASLVAGYLSTLVPDGTTTIRVMSDSVCKNYIDIPIDGITTTTTTTIIPCSCYYYDVYITQTDIDNATGNTDINRNGKVFVSYRNCDDSGFTTLQYTIANFYGNAFCMNSNPIYSPVIDVWQNDVQITYTSSALNTEVCCSSSTTTTTSTTILPVPCNDYYNNTGGTLNGIDYTACDGTPYTNQSVAPGQSICVQGNPTGGDSGFLILLGNC